MKNVCQSCGMPLQQKSADFRGTEADGSKTNTYCNRCYLNGKFTNPNMTKKQMIEIGINAIDAQQMGSLKKKFIKKTYPYIIGKLDRWK